MSNPAKIGVIVVSYNTAPLLRACLRSLTHCRLPLQVIVVDNASADGSADVVRDEFPAVALLTPGYNAGYAGGTNLGLAALPIDQESAPDYVLILNPDTEVRPGAIERLAAFLDEHPRVGLVGPRLLNPDGTRQDAAFRFPTLSMAILDLFPPGEVLPGRLYRSWWHGRYPQEAGDEAFAIDHPLGACMLIRSATLREVGGMDANYFMYSEEVDWCRRIRQAGWAIWHVPTAEVVHVGGAATSQFRWKMFSALYRSRARFVDLYEPAWYRRTYHLIVRAGILRLSLLAWLKYQRSVIDISNLRAQLLAYADVLRQG